MLRAHRPPPSIESTPAMTYQPHPPQATQPPGPPPQPAAPLEAPKQAGLAMMMLLGLAVVTVISSVREIIFANGLIAEVEKLMNTSAEDLGVSGAFGDYITLAVGAGFWILMALLVKKGANAARIIALIFAILSAVAGALMLALNGTPGEVADIVAALDLLGVKTSEAELVPGWYLPTGYAVSALRALVAVGAVVFLFNKDLKNWMKARKNNS